MVLPNLAMDNRIHDSIYNLKPCFKGFIKPQTKAMTDASFNEAMTIVLKLEENV